MKKKNAFTLIELLVASSIFVIIAAGIYSAFHTGMFGYRNVEENINSCQSAALVLNRIDLDLRNAFAYKKGMPYFSGGKETISFLSITDTYSSGGLSGGLAYLCYRKEGDKITRLYRKGKNSLNEKSPVPADEMAEYVKALTFTYGYASDTQGQIEWKDTWENQQTLPQAVMINLSIGKKVDRNFERTIFLQNPDTQNE